MSFLILKYLLDIIFLKLAYLCVEFYSKFNCIKLSNIYKKLEQNKETVNTKKSWS